MSIEFLIVVQFDNVYWRWAYMLLRSLALVTCREKVVFYSMGLSNNEMFVLYDIYPNLIIHNEAIFLPCGRMRRYKMANRKAKIFQHAMLTYKADVYALMDADMLIRKPLDALYACVAEHDAALVFRPHSLGNHTKINSSLVIAKPNATPLIDEWVSLMEGKRKLYTVEPSSLTWWERFRNRKYKPKIKPICIRRGRWFWDQITLYKATQIVPLNYATLSEQMFINGAFDGDAHIWSAHVNKAMAYERFLQELKQRFSQKATC